MVRERNAFLWHDGPNKINANRNIYSSQRYQHVVDRGFEHQSRASSAFNNFILALIEMNIYLFIYLTYDLFTYKWVSNTAHGGYFTLKH